tara:strand:- start:345 stop:602 length:258 start_codon:yes stop_codon:yes gene_type:complete
MTDTTKQTLKIQVPTEWANEWPCSRLAGKEINVVLDGRDLVDFWITRESLPEDLEGAELTAVIERHLEEKAKKKFIDEKVMFVAV